MTPVDRDTSIEILKHRRACDLCLRERCSKKCEHRKEYTYKQIQKAYDEAIACMESEPTADAAEVKHGKWVTQNHSHTCSLCDWYYYGSNKMNYCPNCGAKMDGKKD